MLELKEILFIMCVSIVAPCTALFILAYKELKYLESAVDYTYRMKIIVLIVLLYALLDVWLFIESDVKMF